MADTRKNQSALIESDFSFINCARSETQTPIVPERILEKSDHSPAVLVVEDNPFIIDLLVPTLRADESQRRYGARNC